VSTFRKKLIPDEAKLGVAFLLAVVIFVLGLFYLKDWRITSDTYLLEGEFQDVNGVNRGDPVMLGGVRIGKVESVRLENQIPIVLMRLEDPYPLPQDSRLETIDRSVMGEKALIVHKGSSPDIATTGERLFGKSSPGLSEIMLKADTLGLSVQTLLNNANTLLDPASGRSIRTSLNNVHEITETLLATLNQERQQIHRTVAGMEKLVGNMQELSVSEKTKIANTLTNLEKCSDELNTMIARLQRTTVSLETILSRIEQGEGTVGKLIKDDKLYNDMDRLMVNLDGLIMDIKNNPKRYLSIEIF